MHDVPPGPEGAVRAWVAQPVALRGSLLSIVQISHGGLLVFALCSAYSFGPAWAAAAKRPTQYERGCGISVQPFWPPDCLSVATLAAQELRYDIQRYCTL
jgi:hypothetical protein